MDFEYLSITICLTLKHFVYLSGLFHSVVLVVTLYNLQNFFVESLVVYSKAVDRVNFCLMFYSE